LTFEFWKIAGIAGFCLVTGTLAGSMLEREFEPCSKSPILVQMPIEVVVVTVPAASRNAYFDAIRRFADTFGFAQRIGVTNPDGPNFVIQLYREDFKIIGANGSGSEVTRFRIPFYFTRNNEDAPNPGAVKKLRRDLVRILKQIDGIQIVGES